MKDYTIENFKNWDQIADYESDENTVTLLNKEKKAVAQFSFYRFTKMNFDHFKNKSKKSTNPNPVKKNGIEIIGYNVEYWVRSPKHTFLAKGVITGYKKQGKHGRGSYSGGVYMIKCGEKTFAKRRCEFTVLEKKHNP